jgi:hypothetical protein
MVRNTFRIIAVVASVILPSVSVAEGCVADVDEVVTVRENGSRYHVDRLVHYLTYISARDMRNSKGVRLGTFAQVIQQDRADLHERIKSSGDPTMGVPSDDWDGYFTSVKRRGQLSTARYYVDCNRSLESVAKLKSNILNGQLAASLWVVVFRHPDGGLGVYLSEVN